MVTADSVTSPWSVRCQAQQGCFEDTTTKNSLALWERRNYAFFWLQKLKIREARNSLKVAQQLWNGQGRCKPRSVQFLGISINTLL